MDRDPPRTSPGGSIPHEASGGERDSATAFFETATRPPVSMTGARGDLRGACLPRGPCHSIRHRYESTVDSLRMPGLRRYRNPQRPDPALIEVREGTHQFERSFEDRYGAGKIYRSRDERSGILEPGSNTRQVKRRRDRETWSGVSCGFRNPPMVPDFAGLTCLFPAGVFLCGKLSCPCALLRLSTRSLLSNWFVRPFSFLLGPTKARFPLRESKTAVED